PEGSPLPRLARLVFDIVPDENARLLRFRSGQVDIVELLTPDAFDSLLRENEGELELRDLGPGLLSERLWFNLNPDAAIDERKKRWFQDVRFRRAVAATIDRRAMARVVFSGRATPASGPVSVANFIWRDESLSEIEHDPEAARSLLTEAGFRWDGEGSLLDEQGQAVSFTILTNSESAHRTRMGAFLQEDLAKLGIEAQTAPVQGASIMGRVTGSFDYDAGLLGISQTDPDPSAEMALWLSRGPFHFWHPRQKTPATPWEERIDALMEEQLGELELSERRNLYFEVQRIVTEWRPVIDLVVPHALLGAQRRVLHLRPTSLAHVLWNSEEIDIGDPEARSTLAICDARH
ncbi:MAG: ABC transporter substrate-binding protein, partial [Vicinamibacteria bacterium]